IDKFTVQTIVTGNATIVPADSAVVAYGDSLVITVNPAPGHHVDSIVVGGVQNVGPVVSYTLHNVTGPQSVHAFISADQFSIVATAHNGSIIPPGTTIALYGDTVRYQYLPVTAGWHFDSLVIDGVVNTDSTASYAFVGVDSAHSIDAYFSIDKHSVTASAVNGTITPSGVTLVDHNGMQSYSFAPQPGYHFDSLIVDGVPVPDSASSYTFTAVSAPHTITAYFGQNALHHFIVESSVGGPIPNQSVGTSFLIRTRAVDSMGTVLPWFTGTVWFSSSDTTMNVTGGLHSIAFTAGEHGPQNVTLFRNGSHTITVIDSVSGKQGTSAPFTVNAGPLNHFSLTNLSDAPIDTQRQNVPFDVKVTAYDTFNNIKDDYVGTMLFTVPGSSFSVGGGHVPSVPGGVLAPYSLAIADSGDYVISVVDSATLIGVNSNTFVVLPDRFNVIASAVNGTVLPSDTTVVMLGSSFTLNYLPDAGHHFDSVVVDGVTILDSTSSYTFTNVASAHSIEVYYSPDQYTLTVNGVNASTVPNGIVPVTFGTSIRVTYAPVAGHHMDSVVVDGVANVDSLT
ncbi:MAG: hypothetical protein HUU02_17155, partial [Bacteroidetes bacterium]|nr:hypothetical protein [Bacteroidota bacterium]